MTSPFLKAQASCMFASSRAVCERLLCATFFLSLHLYVSDFKAFSYCEYDYVCLGSFIIINVCLSNGQRGCFLMLLSFVRKKGAHQCKWAAGTCHCKVQRDGLHAAGVGPWNLCLLSPVSCPQGTRAIRRDLAEIAWLAVSDTGKQRTH